MEQDKRTLRDYSLAYVLRIVALEERLRAEGKSALLVQEVLKTAIAVDEELLRLETTRPRLADDFLAGVRQILPSAGKSLYLIDLLHAAGCLSEAEHAALHAEGSTLIAGLRYNLRTIERKIKQFEKRKSTGA